jgi:hypothetical protein
VIEPRIYRAAFLPALFALVVVAFSLESPPRALEQGPAADVLFEGANAINSVRAIVEAAPDRRAGSPGDKATAERVTHAFRRAGFSTTADRFEEDGRDLVNVVGRRAGDSTRSVVVLAARDSSEPPDAPGSAADTAALLEFARIFQGRALGRTLVLGSVDGGELGDAGVRRFAERIENPDDVAAVIVMSDLGARRSRGPLIVEWSNGTARSGLALQRTLTASLREEIESVPPQEGTLGQFARLAFPIAPGGQGVALDNGLDAVRVSGSGEVGAGGGRVEDVNVDRYGALGRGVLRIIGTLDAAGTEPERGEKAYLKVGGMILPASVLKLLAIALILPALVASIDALARARRRREPVAPWVAWLAAGALPFFLALVVAWLMVLTGLIEDAPSAPLDPSSVEFDATAISALVATSLTALLAWMLVRTRVVRRASTPPDASAPGAACAVSLALAAIALAVALVNPFAALVLVPAVHLWLLATLTDANARASLVLTAAGLLPILAVVAYYMWRFELGPPSAAYYLLLLVTGNQTGLLTTAAGIALLAITASVIAIVVARARAGIGGGLRGGGRVPEEPRKSVFGPGGHAGPGMLGGTESSRVQR